MSLDKTLFLIADYEIFVPLSDDVPERFATKARLRAGLGYRRDKKWRFELLYIRDGTRQTDEEASRRQPTSSTSGSRCFSKA